MSTTDYPPTPPHLPDAHTPPPKDSFNRPSSPDPNCAICLGELENMSYTDSCFHKFCFTCLLEWSKVKPECPLCKAKFKSIIHTIKSDQVYESYTIPPAPRPIITPESMAFLQEVRRFRYATTGGGNGDRFPFFSLPAIPIPITNISLSRNRVLDQNRHTPSWRRRGGLATTDVRRNIYRQNMYVNPDSVVDTTGRYRETSPEWFRSNPAQTHRLVPWLNRELNALLEDPQRTNYSVTQEILELITQHDIRSNEFRQRIFQYLGIRTSHFQHEFYNYARSCYDMVGHDLHAVYAENPRSNITTEIISTDSSSSNSDSDDIFVLGEFHSDRQPTSDSQPSAASTRRSRRNSSDEATPSTSNGRQQQIVDEGPSTSRGISQLSSSQFLISSDDEVADSRRSVDKSSEDVDNVDVEVVGYIKPRHLRTPVIVGLSSEDEEHAEAVKTEKVVKNENIENETIEISDSEEEIQVAPRRWSISSDDEALGRKRVKGKGKGKNSRIKSSGPKSTSQQSSSTTTRSPPSATVASSSTHESEAVVSEAALTSSPTTASDERSRLISPMGLISTWRSQRTTRDSSSSRSRSRDPSTEKYKSDKDRKKKRQKRSSTEKSSRKEERKHSEEDRSKDRKRKSRKGHEERRKERRHKAESDSWRKKDESCGESSKRSWKDMERKRPAVSYSDSEERPLAQRKRQKIKSTTEESRSGSQQEGSSSRLESGREENRRNPSPQHSNRDVDDLRYLISRKKPREPANRRVFLTTSTESDSDVDEPKLKSIIVKIKRSTN